MLTQYPLGSSKYRPGTAIADAYGPLPYSDDCHLPDILLFHMRHTVVLAPSTSVCDLYLALLDGVHVRDDSSPKPVPAFSSGLVILCGLFPRAAAPLRTTPADTKVYIRLPPARDHFPWRIRSVRDRGTRVLQAVPRDNQYAPHSRRQLPHSLLQGICACHGPCKRVPRIVRESTHQRWR